MAMKKCNCFTILVIGIDNRYNLYVQINVSGLGDLRKMAFLRFVVKSLMLALFDTAKGQFFSRNASLRTVHC